MGDFNATVSGEGRLSPARGMNYKSAEPLSREVDSCMGTLTELCQDAYTHRVVHGNSTVNLSRIDRIYCSLMPHELSDLHPCGGVWDRIEDLAFPSDPVPV